MIIKIYAVMLFLYGLGAVFKGFQDYYVNAIPGLPFIEKLINILQIIMGILLCYFAFRIMTGK